MCTTDIQYGYGDDPSPQPADTAYGYGDEPSPGSKRLLADTATTATDSKYNSKNSSENNNEKDNNKGGGRRQELTVTSIDVVKELVLARSFPECFCCD